MSNSSPLSPVLSPDEENRLLHQPDDNTVRPKSTVSDEFSEKMDLSDQSNDGTLPWIDKGQQNADRVNQQMAEDKVKIKMLESENKRLRHQVGVIHVHLFSEIYVLELNIISL